MDKRKHKMSVTRIPEDGAENLGAWMVSLVEEYVDGEPFTITGYDWKSDGSVTVHFVARLGPGD